jgi:hypothetical protein
MEAPNTCTLNSPFVKLPGEIRNQIYTHLLVIPYNIFAFYPGNSRVVHPQILTVCRQVHAEARQILYGSNTFIADLALLTPLPQLTIRYRKIYSSCLISLIRRYHIRVRLDCDPNYTYDVARESFSGLESLTIEIWQAQFGSSDHEVLRLFEGVRNVKNLQIIGSISRFPDYIEWLHKRITSDEGSAVDIFDGDPKKDDVWAVSYRLHILNDC